MEFLERELRELDNSTIMLIPVSEALNFVEPATADKL
jgi:hypothetical protein